MMTDDQSKEFAKSVLSGIDHPRAGDIFRHYKGGLYAVVVVGFDEDDPSIIRVGYRSLERGPGPGQCQFRTLANWRETVGVPGVPRFDLEVPATGSGVPR